MSPEETAGKIDMAFGMWGAVGPSNHVLDGGPVQSNSESNSESELLSF